MKINEGFVLPENLKLYVRGPLINTDKMLNPPAAWLTCIVIDIHKRSEDFLSNQYNILEIGVFKGNFLCLLDRAVQKINSKIVGIDPFLLEGQDITAVKKIMKEKGADFNKVNLIKGFSDETSKFINYSGIENYNLIHVDGSHRYQDVYNDMKIVDSLLSNNGVLIMDDFLKSRQLEVLEAIMDYLKNQNYCNVSPFAISGGKLFLCRPDNVDYFKEIIISYSRENMDIGSCSQLINNIENKEKWWAFQKFIKNEILVF